MHFTQETYNLLLRSLDEELPAAEQMRLEQALTESEALRREKTALLAMRDELAAFSASPDPTFSARLMQTLDKRRSPVINLQRYAYYIAAACVVLLLGLGLGLYGLEGEISTEVLVGIQDLSPEDAYTLISY